MSDNSAIEWTDATWNPVSGCTKISPGCANCYAERFAERWRGIKGHPYEHGFDVTLHHDRLDQPSRWKNPRRVFVNSMSDLFHLQIPSEYVGLIVNEMRDVPRHIYQVLTKRSVSMARFLYEQRHWLNNLSHIWWGVSVENRKHGLPRIEHLRQCPVPVRWLSIEPLLEDLGTINLDGIAWVVVGGESGPGARPMEADWARSIRDKCKAAGTKFFMKQMGGNRKPFDPIPDDLFIREFPNA